MAAINGWTPTEKRLLDALRDGQPHHPDELRALLNDDMADRATLSVHLCNMRKKLKDKRWDILCVWFRRRRFYQMIKHIPAAMQRFSSTP